MAQNDKCFFEGFVVAVVLTFLPFKAIAFVIPFLFYFYFLMRSKSFDLIPRFTYVVLGLGLLLCFYACLYRFEEHTFIFSNGILSFINYSSFLVLLLLPNRVTSEKYNYEFYVKCIMPFLVVEGAVGIMQRIGSHLKGVQHGDLVEGTINPLSVISGHTSGFGNQFFAINMIFFLIFCFPYIVIERKRIVPFAIGFLAVILASVGHVFYSLILGVSLVMIYFEGRFMLVNPKRLFLVIAIPITMLTALATLDENVFNDASRQANLFLTGRTPKSQAISIVFNEVAEQYPAMHVVGLGPGQYSSRAGIIASGHYGPLSDFFTKLPFLNLGMTEAFEEHVLPYWLDYKNNSGYGNSTMNRPYLSLLSIYSEYGCVTLIALMTMVALYCYRSKVIYDKAKKARSKMRMLQCLSFSTSLLFLLLIGIYENYYEAPQGVFVGILLIVVSYRQINMPIVATQHGGEESRRLIGDYNYVEETV